MPKILPATDRRYYYTTGFHDHEITELAAAIHPFLPQKTSWHGRNPRLGLFKQVALVLASLRQNMSQAIIGEFFGVSQPTVSRITAKILPLLQKTLAKDHSQGPPIRSGDVLIVDGTLCPAWSKRSQRECFSGKHRRWGMNVQIVCDVFTDRIRQVSEPLPGSVHDAKAITASGLLETPGATFFGDK